eukprot:1035855-Amphidinium_carterae.1
MQNKCLRCGSEAHLVKACTRPSKRKDARALQPEDRNEGDRESEQQYDEEDGDQDYQDKVYKEDQDEYEPVDADYVMEQVEANAASKGKGKGNDKLLILGTEVVTGVEDFGAVGGFPYPRGSPYTLGLPLSSSFKTCCSGSQSETKRRLGS